MDETLKTGHCSSVMTPETFTEEGCEPRQWEFVVDHKID